MKEKYVRWILFPGYIITKEKNSNIFTNGKYTQQTIFLNVLICIIFLDNSGTNQVYHSLVDVISDKEAKSVLSKLHELADFNNLEYKYTLTKEEVCSCSMFVCYIFIYINHRVFRMIKRLL